MCHLVICNGNIITTCCHAEENINIELINKMSGISIVVSIYICLDINKNHFD